MSKNKTNEYNLEELPLDKIRGCYDGMDNFYEYMKEKKYKIDKLKEDIKKEGLINPLIVWNTENEYSQYKYFIKDGNHRLQLLKDITIEDNKKLEAIKIPVFVIKGSNNEDIMNNTISKIKKEHYI
tara:strand:- start:75 stop:452 length:378 start_codon:yes stop_codon:yes gene_type:complete